VETAFNNLTSADLNLTYQQSQLQASQDSVVYSVYQDYLNILQDETAQDAAQQALSLANLQQRSTVLNNQLGGASQYQVQQANQSSAQAQTNLSTAEANLTTAYQQFNQLVGLAPDDRPALTDQPSFTPLVMDSLDAEVNRVLAASPSILKAQDAVSADKQGLNVVSYVTSANYSSADSLNIDENGLASTENSVAQSERNMYYNITNLESQQSSLQQALDTAEANLQSIQVGYSVGYNDSLDLAGAQSAVTTAKQNLLDNDCQHQLDVMLFETPWASSGSSGS
jgi:outer membrane protein TolC